MPGRATDTPARLRNSYGVVARRSCPAHPADILLLRFGDVRCEDADDASHDSGRGDGRGYGARVPRARGRSGAVHRAASASAGPVASSRRVSRNAGRLPFRGVGPRLDPEVGGVSADAAPCGLRARDLCCAAPARARWAAPSDRVRGHRPRTGCASATRAGAPRGNKRYTRRNATGQFTEQEDVGRSLAQDRRRRAKHAAPRGQGDKGDRRTRRRN